MKKGVIVLFSFILVLSLTTPALAATNRWSRYQLRAQVTTPVPTQAPNPSPAPAPTPTPTPTPTPVTPPIESPTTFATQLEDEIYARINDERVKNGRAQLVRDSKLATLARVHSADMLTNNYFSHTNLSGCTVSCRFSNAGYSYWSYGENIYWMSGYTLTPEAAADMVVNGWMNSSGHRANILNSTFTNQGIGVAFSGKTIYVTQDFAKPR